MEEESSIDVSEMIQYLDQQKNNINYDKVEKAVLFLGRTGTGKSTLTHFLVDPTKIQCVGKEGQFVMTDEEGFISDPESTILSKTIFPKPVEYEAGLYYMDCPGFRDTRSFSMEIVSTVFTKKALKNCRGVKLIFVISYEEVKTGGDRNAFIELIENASDFISELDKFDNSIALFVTKVPNLTKVESGSRVLIPDRTMKQHVKDFLKTTLNTIQNPVNITKGKRNVFKKATQFIRILLEDDENNDEDDEGDHSSRIGIFRAPEEEGPISEIQVFQQAKESLNFIIHHVLEFTDVSDEDFGYTISSGSKLCIMKAIEDSVQSVGEILAYTCAQAMERWQSFEKTEDDFQKLNEHFVGELSQWRKTYDRLQTVEITSEALNCLIEHVLQEKDTADETVQLQNLSELIDLMEMVSNEKYRISIAKWTRSFRQAFDEVSGASDWYGRLPILILIFKYTTQQRGPKQVREFMEKLDLWIDKGKPVSGEVLRTTLSLMAKEFSVLQISYEVSTVKLKHLNQLCKMGKLDRVEKEVGFLGGLKRFIVAGANVILNFLSGKMPSEGDVYNEVRKICHMDD